MVLLNAVTIGYFFSRNQFKFVWTRTYPLWFLDLANALGSSLPAYHLYHVHDHLVHPCDLVVHVHVDEL